MGVANDSSGCHRGNDHCRDGRRVFDCGDDCEQPLWRGRGVVDGCCRRGRPGLSGGNGVNKDRFRCGRPGLGEGDHFQYCLATWFWGAKKTVVAAGQWFESLFMPECDNLDAV
jgi:hypothetical protein